MFGPKLLSHVGSKLVWQLHRVKMPQLVGTRVYHSDPMRARQITRLIDLYLKHQVKEIYTKNDNIRSILEPLATPSTSTSPTSRQA